MNIKSEKGVTLTEVIGAVTILMILMVPLSFIFTTTYDKCVVEADKVAAQQVAREILYGDGINFNGIMGDLEKSNAKIGDLHKSNSKSSEVVIEDIPPDGCSISIPASNGIREYLYDSNVGGGVVLYNGKRINDKSSSGKEINITGFTVQPIYKNDLNDNDQLRVQVRVLCGKSGIVEVESSYRFPNIEK
ncbi:prepilin-type N-terminal cleavage/methylation domain-containing protein [Ruminiclostridium papyrosolvens]|uniref:Uncharacterized protein n=1 Tax=Ruminiclostridium papyrosolvens C7 TaxID=1330534 RepID=U4QYP2_9FIRM|nr:prepilin-type N-terminal cleavage/methylation domain-containing protein [Ruminiclostridium papyrosolvens]EPR09950.1 hypothetical protein L323_15375 [Ruminiclostridium papyrosolvens C7]